MGEGRKGRSWGKLEAVAERDKQERMSGRKEEDVSFSTQSSNSRWPASDGGGNDGKRRFFNKETYIDSFPGKLGTAMLGKRGGRRGRRNTGR